MSKRPAPKDEGGKKADDGEGSAKKKPNMRDGDWMCADCDSHNYNARLTCFRCNMDKEKSELKTKGKAALDWECFLCKTTNFGWRRECFKCRATREESEDRKAREVGMEWLCPKCSVVNFPDRPRCFKCKQPREMLDRNFGGRRDGPPPHHGGYDDRRGYSDHRGGYDEPMRRDMIEPRGRGPHHDPREMEFEPRFGGRGGRRTPPRGDHGRSPLRGGPPPPDRMGRPRSPPPGPAYGGRNVALQPSPIEPPVGGPGPAEEWKCGLCETFNGIRRDSCYKCATARDACRGAEEQTEWPCPECHTSNHHSKFLCFRCNAPRPDEIHEGPVRREFGPDWDCGFCKVSIFPTRPDCYKCGRLREECEVKPQEGAERFYGEEGRPVGGEGPIGGEKWRCLECGLDNFPRRVDCFKCGRPREDLEPMRGPGPQMRGPGPQISMRRVSPGPRGRGPYERDGPRDRSFDGPRDRSFDGPRDRSFDGPRGRSPLLRGPHDRRDGPWDGPRVGPRDGPRGGPRDAPRGGPRGDRYSEIERPRNPLRPGEWMCSKCKVNNYPKRTRCFKCEAPRMAVDPLLKEGRPLQPGEWTCSNCKGLNYSRRTDCYKCKTPKNGKSSKKGASAKESDNASGEKLDLDREPGIELNA